MDLSLREEVATTLAQAWIDKTQIDRLAEHLRPSTDAEAQAIQEIMIRTIGKEVGGWKVGTTRPIRGAMFASIITQSPATLPARQQHLRAIEGEIAFIFPRGLLPRATDYAREEVADAVLACAAIEIVDSRYRDFSDVSDLEKLADLLSSGGFVQGEGVEDWQHLDFGQIAVELIIDGELVLQRCGGHATGDPLHACVMFVNAVRVDAGVAPGSVVTTGTYTGMPRLAPGSTAIVRFAGLGESRLTFTA
jgi:2-keto-4-pentenoate hydratase